MTQPYDVTYRGLRVPWVTRWTDERRPWPQSGNANFRRVPLSADVSYFDLEMPDGWGDALSERGVVWWDELPGLQSAGTPEWSQVASTRQRAAMRERLCQVCSLPAGPDWLVPRHLLLPMKDTWVTTSPPVCDACAPIAFRQCPHLRLPGIEVVRLRDVETRVWGVDGDGFVIGKEGLRQQQTLFIEYLNPDAPAEERLLRYADVCLVGKQQVVELGWRTSSVEKSA